MESNLPFGEVWLKTCGNTELKTSVPAIAMSMLRLLYFLGGSPQKVGKWLWQKFKNKELFAFFSLGSCCLPNARLPRTILAEPPPCPGRVLVPLPEKEGYLLLVEREVEDGEETGQWYSCALTGFSWVSGAALSLPGSASLEKGLRMMVYYQDLDHPDILQAVFGLDESENHLLA